MQTHYSQHLNIFEVDSFNAMIGSEENRALTKKQQRNKRMSAARRAIEKHHENKQLSNDVNEIWLGLN
ncbi:MAG: hypothetical protein HRU05_05445 [Oceanospirillaceae bacterium]|nr:hypothetical protein [Oceanospirillaceae bacterium]